MYTAERRIVILIEVIYCCTCSTWLIVRFFQTGMQRHQCELLVKAADTKVSAACAECENLVSSHRELSL